MRTIIAIIKLVLISSVYSNDISIVDLQVSDTYRALFDAGLRPRKAFREEVDGLLEIRPSKSISYRIDDMQVPPIEAIWSFDVANNDQITVIRGTVEEAWTKAEAFEKTWKLEEALGGDVEALKQWIDSYPSPSPTGDLWGRRWRSDDGTRSVSYYFRHTMQDARPLTISISIELHWPGRKRGFRETPVKPPAGYEHVDISFDETYGGTATIPAAQSSQPVNQSNLKKAPTEFRAKAKASQLNTSTIGWSIGLTIVVILAVVSLMYLLRKSRK